MIQNRLIFGAFLLAFAVCGERTLAHYLWVVSSGGQKTEPVANLYFEESPAAGDGHYLDHFLGSSDVWIRTLEAPDPSPVKATEVKQGDNRWMQVSLPDESEYSVDSYGKFGVYAYGKTNVLLHYYARNLKIESHDAIHELGRAEQMDLDIVPHDLGEQLEITLLWKGKPVPDRMVFARGPAGFRKNVKTDTRGRILLPLENAGNYTFRSSVEVKTAGEENGESYEFVRHNITLMMKLPLGEGL